MLKASDQASRSGAFSVVSSGGDRDSPRFPDRSGTRGTRPDDGYRFSARSRFRSSISSRCGRGLPCAPMPRVTADCRRRPWSLMSALDVSGTFNAVAHAERHSELSHENDLDAMGRVCSAVWVMVHGIGAPCACHYGPAVANGAPPASRCRPISRRRHGLDRDPLCGDRLMAMTASGHMFGVR